MSVPLTGFRAKVRSIVPTGLPQTLRALPEIDRRLALIVGVTTIVIGLAPVGYIVATKFLIDELAQSTNSVSIAAIALVAGFFALNEILNPYFHALAETFGYWINRALRMRLMRASMGPKQVRHVEAADAQDVLVSAARIGSSGLTPGAAIAGLATIGKSYVQGIGCAVLLSTFRWWLGPLFLIVAAVVSAVVLHDFAQATRVLTGQSPVLRRANYFRGVTTDARLAGELRLLFLGEWMLARFREHWTSAMQDTWRARRPKLVRMAVGTAAVVATVSGATALMADETRNGSMSIGSFVMYIQALLGFLPMFVVSLRHLNVINGAAVMAAVAEFESQSLPSSPIERGRYMPAAKGDLVFDRVRFRYHADASPVLDGVSFEVPAGSSLAIVGLNGAGKTTLIKLLARLNELDTGEILWDGKSIRSFDIDCWRQHLAVLFQDFLRLPFTAVENVQCGALHLPLDEAALAEAAAEGNATGVIDALPLSWSTRLVRGYHDGTELSGGQWQRIAAARAFYAVHQGAGVLVLDEPSSAQDVRAETQFFARFHELRDVTRILISHRLAPVRHADRIVLLDGGAIREQGTHDALMKLDGLYATLFRKQMARSVI